MYAYEELLHTKHHVQAIHDGVLRVNEPTAASDDLVDVLLAMPHLHIMRAPDPHLIVHFHDRQCDANAQSDEYQRCVAACLIKRLQ